jgi:hypothetical protein
MTPHRPLFFGGTTVRRLLVLSAALLALIALSVGLRAADKPDDTPAAAKTRALLQTKVSCDYKDTPTRDMLDDLESQVPGLKFKTATDGTIKLNHNFTFTTVNKDTKKDEPIPVTDALEKMFGPIDWGYIVVSQKGNAYDGVVQVRGGKERGYPADKDK